MFTEAQNFAIVQTELDNVFFQKFQYDATEPGIATARTGEIFKPINTEHASYIQEVFAGSGLFPKIGETQAVPVSTPHVTNKQTTLVNDYAQSIPISKDLFDDNMFGTWSRTVEDFARKALITQDNNAFGLFRGAFTTTLTADGVSACNSAHPLIGGGTTSNTNTGAGSALSDTSLYNGIVQMRQQVDQKGVIMGNVPSILLVPSKLFKLARQLTDSALVADSANNAINIYRSAYGMTVWSSPYLDAVAGGSDTAWFLLAPNHSVSRLIRQGIETALTPWQYSNNRSYTYQANFREAYFITDYIGLVGFAGV